MRPLKSFEPVLSQILRLTAKKTVFYCEPDFAQALKENPRLVVALSHSSPLSWLPSACLLALEALAAGGGERRPMGVMDNFFFHLPGVREIAQWLTQTDRPLAYQELAERFETRGDFDLVLFPEGSNCFFGRPDEIQPFRSPKFVELAIRAQCPILIGVHIGSEHWARAVPISSDVIKHLDWLPNIAFDFVERRLRQTGLFALPLLPKPMESFQLSCELYHPALKQEDLSGELLERREQIREESERIRLRMVEMLRELKDHAHELSGQTSEAAESELIPNLNSL